MKKTRVAGRLEEGMNWMHSKVVVMDRVFHRELSMEQKQPEVCASRVSTE